MPSELAGGLNQHQHSRSSYGPVSLSSTYVVQPLPELRLSDLVDAYEHLTFPPVEKRAELRQVSGALFGAVALDTEGPVALLVAERRGGARCRLLSLFVLPDHRERGLASHLLARSEELAAERGATELEGFYRTSWRSLAAIERLLRNAGWSPPQTRCLIGRGARDTLGSIGELAPVKLPEGVELFTWRDLSNAEERSILERQEREGWFPQALTPFQAAPRIEQNISVGLRVAGEVAGWMIVHRLSYDTVQYSALFVRHDLRGSGLARALVAEAIRRRLQVPAIRHGVFLVDTRNKPMLRFAEGPLRPLLAQRSELRVSRKKL